MPFNAAGKNAALSGGLGNVIAYIGVLQNGEPGTSTSFSGSEATGGSYARQAVTWAAAASGQRASSGDLTFPVPAGTYSDFLFMSAVTAGTYYGYAPINGSSKQFGVVPDSTAATADLIYSPAHGLAAGDQVRVFNVFSLSLPASTASALAEDVRYYVISTGLTTDAFKLSTSAGGSAVDLTGVGELFWQKVIPETFASAGQIVITSGSLVLDATTI